MIDFLATLLSAPSQTYLTRSQIIADCCHPANGRTEQPWPAVHFTLKNKQRYNTVDHRQAELSCTNLYGSMIFRLSQKLNTKIKAGRLPEMPPNDNPYADWSCHLFTADRTQYILVSNTTSLYSCVLYGRGLTNDSVFIERVLSSLREFMDADGQSFSYQKFVAPASGTISFAKALNRSVTGSMNDLIGHAIAWLEEGDVAPHDLGFRLNDILLSALAMGKSAYGKPHEAFKMLAKVYRPGVV